MNDAALQPDSESETAVLGTAAQRRRGREEVGKEGRRAKVFDVWPRIGRPSIAAPSFPDHHSHVLTAASAAQKECGIQESANGPPHVVVVVLCGYKGSAVPLACLASRCPFDETGARTDRPSSQQQRVRQNNERRLCRCRAREK